MRKWIITWNPLNMSRSSASSVDLVTVAVAIHWFNFDEFYREVKRVLKPDGILAAWTYSLTEISPEIDPLISQYY